MNNENELWYPLRRNSFEYALSPILSKDEQKSAPEAAKPAPAPVPAPAPAVTPEEKLPSLDDPAPAKEHKAASFHTASMQEEPTEMPKRPAAPARPAPAPSVMKKPELNSEAPASVQQTSGSAEKKRNMRLAVLALCIVVATTAAVVCVSKFGKRLPKAEESVSDSRKDEDEEKDAPEDSRPDAPESATDVLSGQDSAVESDPQKETGTTPETQSSTEAANDPSDPTDPQGGTETQAETSGLPSSVNSEQLVFEHLFNSRLQPQCFACIAAQEDGSVQLYYTDQSAGQVTDETSYRGSYMPNADNMNSHRYQYVFTAPEGTDTSEKYLAVTLQFLKDLIAGKDYHGDYAVPPEELELFKDTGGNSYLGRYVSNIVSCQNTSDSSVDGLFNNCVNEWGSKDVFYDKINTSGFVLLEDTWTYYSTIPSTSVDASSSSITKYEGSYEVLGEHLYIFNYQQQPICYLWVEDNGEIFFLEYRTQ